VRPDGRSRGWSPVGDSTDGGADGYGPLDARLESLDAELEAAGIQARRSLQGRTQPTRFFSIGLRERLLAGDRKPATRQ